jgi:hypothetical protein
VSTGEILDLARPALAPPFSAVFLFGSYARGDQDASSDIDILQVTPTRGRSYNVGKINVTCYTPDQLVALARGGAMFARHIALEAIPLIDPDDFLSTLKSSYVPAATYRDVCDSVACSIPLVAITEKEFAGNAHHYSATASYLLRTYVYARAFASGTQSFSMREVANHTGDYRPRARLMDLRADESFDKFMNVVDLLYELTGTKPCPRRESIEAFIVNSYGACDLAVVLGLRILARGDLMSYVFMRSKR